MKELFGFDAFSPKEIAERIEQTGVVKSRLPLLALCMLGILAGVFIGLGAMFYVLVVSDTNLGFAWSRLLSGFVFSLGLIMVTVAGAELFTGNNLLVMAWADGKISLKSVLRNWGVVSLSNFVGALLLAYLLSLTRYPELNQGKIGTKYVMIAAEKCQLTFQQAFFSGILCNILVCLAVWMAQAGRTIIDKFIVIVFPVAAFVACGFEHSVANMFLIPMGILLKETYPIADWTSHVNWSGFFQNMLPVILGNLVGGSGFVAITYYLIYGKSLKKTQTDHS